MLPEGFQEFAPALAIERAGADIIEGGNTRFGEYSLDIAAARIADAVQALKNDGFERLASVTAVDRYPLEPRFEVVYHLQSVAKNVYVRLKCRLGGESPEIDSVTSIYPSANWYERETWDFFGIRFTNHPNLTRIMMPDAWEGHPLRRDYPVHGFKYSYQNE